MNLYPFNDVLKQADAAIAKGAQAFQQFTCSGCGAKQTMEEPDTFYTSGKCEECGHITDIRTDGCNFMVIAGGMPK